MRLLEDAVAQAFNQTGRQYIPSRAIERDRGPFIDLIDSGREYVLTAELAGARKEDILIDATEDEIVLSIEDSDEEESRYAGLSESFPLADKIRPNDIKAKYRNGVLQVWAPKKKPREGRKIDVK